MIWGRQKDINKQKIMNIITARDFRNNLSATLDRVDAGERILVRRRNRVYTIIPVEEDDLTITPELQAKIDKARQECKEAGQSPSGHMRNWMLYLNRYEGCAQFTNRRTISY